MKIYKLGALSLLLSGMTYTADEDGIIDVPDDAVTQDVFAAGFVLADGKLAEIARKKAALAETQTATPAHGIADSNLGTETAEGLASGIADPNLGTETAEGLASGIADSSLATETTETAEGSAASSSKRKPKP